MYVLSSQLSWFEYGELWDTTLETGQHRFPHISTVFISFYYEFTHSYRHEIRKEGDARK